MSIDRELPAVHIADDDDGVRESLAVLFEAHELETRLYASGDELLASLSKSDSGCVLLDYYMPGRNGYETLKALRAEGMNLPVIMITAHGDVGLAVDAMKAGAIDFVEKPWDRDVLIKLVDRAMQTDRDHRAIFDIKSNAKTIIASFTPREKQVFDQLILGGANKVIARELDISPRTVEFYRANVLEKSDVQGVAGLVRLAFLADEIVPTD